MLIKTHINKSLRKGFVTLTDNAKIVKQTPYSVTSYALMDADTITELKDQMDADVAILSRLSGAHVASHRPMCDASHIKFAASCNLNLHPNVVAARKRLPHNS